MTKKSKQVRQEEQQILNDYHKWKEFEYTERDYLVLYAKMLLGRLTTSDIAQHGPLLDSWGYENA